MRVWKLRLSTVRWACSMRLVSSFWSRACLVYLQRLHEAGDALAAEEGQQIVRQREEEAALARIALASGAAAQLVVYTPRLVPLRAEDKEAAHGLDLLGLGVRDLLVLGHALGEQPARGEDFLAVRVRVARGLGDDLLGIPGLLEVVAREILRVAAEHDVRARPAMFVAMVTAPSLPACATISALALMLLGVQDVVRDAALFQKAERYSLFSMLIVPTSTGWPFSWQAIICSMMALSLPASFL